MKIVSINLKKIREEKGLTQKELALKVKTATTYIANIEQGVRMPSLSMVNKLSEVLKVKVKAFFEETN